MHVQDCGCQWYAVAVKMTLAASDSFKPWKLWVYVWYATVCVCVCMQKTFLLEEKTASQLLSGSYQNGTDHLPLLSYQCGVNCLSEAKRGMGELVVCAFPLLLVCWLFLFLLTSVTVRCGAESVPGVVPISLQAIIQIIYLNDRNKQTWQKLIQTTLHRDSSTERWRGKIEREGQISGMREGCGERERKRDKER